MPHLHIKQVADRLLMMALPARRRTMLVKAGLLTFTTVTVTFTLQCDKW